MTRSLARLLRLFGGDRRGVSAVETGAFPVEILETAEAVFVTNAVMGAVPVSTLDGRPVGSGELPARIAALFA